MRDENGDFDANVITADLDGTATGNLPIDGGVLTGGLQIGDSNSDASFVVYGPTTLNGNLSVIDSGQFVVGTNNAFVADPTDGVGIGTIPDYKLDLYQRTNTSASATGTTLFRLTNDVRNFADPAAGDLQQQKTFIDFAFVDDDSNGTPQVRIGAEVGQNNNSDNRNKEGSGAFVVYTATGSSISTNTISEKLRVAYNGNVGINNTNPQYKLDVTGSIFADTTITAHNSMSIGLADSNVGAAMLFLGATGGEVTPQTDDQTQISNFRIGNKLVGDDILEITANDGSQGATTWKDTPAIAIQGSYNRVAINTTSFSGIDNTGSEPETRRYQLNVQGDINVNGQLFQDNAEFVTSRWTESTTGGNIYRLSKVGVNIPDPEYTLDIGARYDVSENLLADGSVNIAGTTFDVNGQNTSVLYANGDKQWIDSYGVFKANRNTVSENITIPTNTNCMSAGPITINNGNIVTIEDGASWSIV